MVLSMHRASRINRAHFYNILGAFDRGNLRAGCRHGVASFLIPNTTWRYSIQSSRSKSNARGISCRRTLTSGSTAATVGPNRKDEIYGLIDNISQNAAELTELLEDLDLLEEHYGALNAAGLENAFIQTVGHRSDEALNERVQMARQRFGDTLPERYLNEAESQLYVRLYGEPIIRDEGYDKLLEQEEEEDFDQLLQENGQGGWEKVEVEGDRPMGDGDDTYVAYDMEAEPEEVESPVMKRTREVAEQLNEQLVNEHVEEEEEAAMPNSTVRRHPLTLEGKFSTSPRTIFLPRKSIVDPISDILSTYSNKHIREKADVTFGGRHLPLSTIVAPPRTQTPQLPIPLDASQHSMSEMEGNVYLAVLYPAIYSSVLSVLTEVRKRLGSEWLRRLISQEGGPNALDASGAGAGIIAWRDIIRSEWELMNQETPQEEHHDIAYGRSTVVAASKVLQVRAAAMLENTTFLPRLPDYVHVRDAPTLDDSRPPPKRKQYDVIIAPHALLGLDGDYLRRDYVDNLWSLLNPNGGVLILLEKGFQRGFEVIAEAREFLLKHRISTAGSTEYGALLDSPGDGSIAKKESGMIVAPCTNHGKCPMYRFLSKPQNRKDFCHFSQRYIRPPFLQRIFDAKGYNHDDVSFSYLAVRRGVDLRQDLGIPQGHEATEAAFTGYGDVAIPNIEGMVSEKEEIASATPAPAQEQTVFHTLSLPRVIYSPMKRRGHVILDVCTPAATMERWTVPRSYGKVAYTDARKAQWGDLWALGAKTRVARNLRLGHKDSKTKKEQFAERAAQRAAQEAGEEDDDEELLPQLSEAERYYLAREEGQAIPKWKKKTAMRKEKLRNRRH